MREIQILSDENHFWCSNMKSGTKNEASESSSSGDKSQANTQTKSDNVNDDIEKENEHKIVMYN